MEALQGQLQVPERGGLLPELDVGGGQLVGGCVAGGGGRRQRLSQVAGRLARLQSQKSIGQLIGVFKTDIVVKVPNSNCISCSNSSLLECLPVTQAAQVRFLAPRDKFVSACSSRGLR